MKPKEEAVTTFRELKHGAQFRLPDGEYLKIGREQATSLRTHKVCHVAADTVVNDNTAAPAPQTRPRAHHPRKG